MGREERKAVPNGEADVLGGENPNSINKMTHGRFGENLNSWG